MFIFAISMVLCFSRREPEAERPPMKRQEILYSLAFATIFIGAAIWYNRRSWFLAVLIPCFIALFISFVTSLVRKPQHNSTLSSPPNTA
jgi:hypothetical protein